VTDTAVDWPTVLANGLEVPEGVALEDLYGALSGMLLAADPAVRDDTAYPILATWVARGEFDGRLRRVGDDMADRLWHPEIQARTFATLILGWAVRRDGLTGELDDDTVRRWRDAFVAWWRDETDLRGWDAERGWLHAVAHGADTVRAFGRSPRLGPDDLSALLDLVVARVMESGDHLYAHGEDDRLAYAVTTILGRTGSTGWLAPLAAAFESGEPGPVPPFAANALRFLNSTYVAVHRGVERSEPYGGDKILIVPPPAAVEILDAIAEVLRLPVGWIG
jgi:hypothetical protein